MIESAGIGFLASLFVLQLAVFSTTLYLHRSVTHRAVRFHPVVSWAFRFTLWLTTGILPKQWAAVHRKHHAFTDIDGDPHSPYLEGFWQVQIGTVFYYRREGRNKQTVARYSSDLVLDVWDRILFKRGAVGPLIGTAILCFSLGVLPGVLAALIHMVLYAIVLTPSINGLCHYIGYKNFNNTATNIQSLALLTAGEGLHNNHHRFPSSAKLSFRSSEIDPGWLLLKLLVAVNLAQLENSFRPQGNTHPQLRVVPDNLADSQIAQQMPSSAMSTANGSKR